MRSRKGMDAMIATVLLIAFTIAVAGILSVWISSFTRSQADKTTTAGNSASACASSALFFAQSDINVSAGVVKIVVANEGTLNQTGYIPAVSLKNGTFYTNTTGYSSIVLPGQKFQLTLTTGDTGLTSTANMTSISVALGPTDTCAGRAYKIIF